MTPNRFTTSHDIPQDTVGYPHDKIVLGIHETSAIYFPHNTDPNAPLSRIHHVYHFIDGVLQSLHITTYPFKQYIPGALPADTVRCVDVWSRPTVPERWVFDGSLKNCQRRYTHLDQIYAIQRYSIEATTPGKQPQSQPTPKTDSPESLNSQLTIDLSRRHRHPNYRHPGDR